VGQELYGDVLLAAGQHTRAVNHFRKGRARRVAVPAHPLALVCEQPSTCTSETAHGVPRAELPVTSPLRCAVTRACVDAHGAVAQIRVKIFQCLAPSDPEARTPARPLRR
jgi:hypothetical protein